MINEHPSKKLLNSIISARSRSETLAHKLNALGAHFYGVGNEIVADKLFSVAEELETLIKPIWEAHGESTMSDIKHSEEMMGNLFKLVINTVTKPTPT